VVGQDTERFYSLLDHLPIAALVIQFDNTQVTSLSDQKICFVNRKYLELIGYDVFEAPNSLRWMELAYPDQAYRDKVMQKWREDSAEALRNDEATAKETVKIHCKDGNDRWFEAFSEVRSTIQDGYYIISFVDITEISERVQDYKKLSTIDQLTGVYNQHFIVERLEKELVRAVSSGDGFTLAMVDLDFFKTINDRYGTACGDHVLIEMTNSFRKTLSSLDCIARWNGSDFLIILREDNPMLAKNIIRKVWQEIRSRTFEWQSHRFAMTVTVGMCSYHIGDQSDNLIDRVGRALQKGKSVGGDFIYFDKE